jgi:hypothetical protein
MSFRLFDWLLLAVAVTGLAAALVSGPICVTAFGSGGPPGCLEWFPIELATGLGACCAAVLVLGIRLRRRAN